MHPINRIRYVSLSSANSIVGGWIEPYPALNMKLAACLWVYESLRLPATRSWTIVVGWFPGAAIHTGSARQMTKAMSKSCWRPLQNEWVGLAIKVVRILRLVCMWILHTYVHVHVYIEHRYILCMHACGIHVYWIKKRKQSVIYRGCRTTKETEHGVYFSIEMTRLVGDPHGWGLS